MSDTKNDYPEHGGWELFKQGKFNDAIDAYTRGLVLRTNASTYNNRSLAFLELGEFDRAIVDLEASDKLSIETNSRSHHALDWIAVIKWMSGRKREAAEDWRAISKMPRRDFKYGDAAGDIEIGLHLWFASCFPEFGDYAKDAELYLRRQSKLTAARSFPGPLAGFVLGETSEDTIKKIAGYPVPAKGFCMSYFYFGMMESRRGKTELFQHRMQQSIDFGAIRMLEPEFYLAKFLLTKR